MIRWKTHNLIPDLCTHFYIFNSANNDNVYVPGHHSNFSTGSDIGNKVHRKSKGHDEHPKN